MTSETDTLAVILGTLDTAADLLDEVDRTCTNLPREFEAARAALARGIRLLDDATRAAAPDGLPALQPRRPVVRPRRGGR